MVSIAYPRKAQIVGLRFFGGLNLDEIAEVIGVAPITVSREWAKARAWLNREDMSSVGGCGTQLPHLLHYGSMTEPG